MYQALYRKYRPQVFADVVGQDHITRTLMNEVKTGRHSHAYLFSGSRGTGKTTCAKIFAKAVNCEHPVNGDPCNECDTCRGIDSGRVLDVVEIDAASNNGVDNIRDIRDEANFTPVGGKYRVYIIDEVHMLSTGAFNALLKTLEEPPEHVKFILATTEVHKLPATILSRCQRFDFRRIDPEDIAGRVKDVAQKEELELTDGAAGLIARLADGALRDALSILDQCMGHGKSIDEAVVNEVVGLAVRQHLFRLAGQILQKDSAGALTTIGDLHGRSVDMERLCSELINHFRNLMVCRTVKDPRTLIVCSGEELQDYIAQARGTTMADILNALNVLGDTLTYIRKGLNRRIEMEMAVIQLCGLSAPEFSNAPITVVNLSVDESATPEEVRSTADYDVPLPGDEAAPAAEPEPPAPAESEPPVLVEPELPEATPAPEELPDQTLAAPAAEAEAESPGKQYVSLENPLPDGLIPTDIWNAVIREATSHDRLLIGTMNAAKAARHGDTLLLKTDNMLLRRFVTNERHKEAIMNATYTVLGDYLTPAIVRDEDLMSYDFFQEEEASAEPVVPLAPPPSEEPGVPEEEPDEVDRLIVEYTDDESASGGADPLDLFVSRIRDLGIDITEE